jgi:hypothetical protein
MSSAEKPLKSDLVGAIDSFLDSKRASKGEDGDVKFLNILEYVDRFKLIPTGLYPAQRFILKLYYNIQLSDVMPEDPSDRIQIKDNMGHSVVAEFTEVQYLKYLYDQKRCNIQEQDGIERREIILVLGRRSGKSALAGIIASYGNPQSYYGSIPGSEIRVLCVANDKEQASIVYSDIGAHVEAVDYFKNSLTSSTLQFMRFQTEEDRKKYNAGGKSSVVATFKSSIAKGLRGRGVICMILDELAFFVDNGNSSAEKIYKAITPSIAQFSPKDPKNKRKPLGPTHGRVISISSPDAKEGFFYRLYQLAMSGGKAAANMLVIQAPTWEINPSLDDSYYETEYHKDPRCILGDSLVYTDKGTFRIEDFDDKSGNVTQNLQYTVCQEGGRRALTNCFYDNGIQDVKEIVTNNGYRIGGTHNQRIKVLSPNGDIVWKRLDEIKIGEFIGINRKINLWPIEYVNTAECDIQFLNDDQLPKKLDEDLGLLIGTVIGNTQVARGRNEFENEICVPRVILQSPETVVAAFLRGLFKINTDGVVLFVSASRQFVAEVQTLLLNFGIMSQIRPNHDMHVITLDGYESIRIFLNKIGFVNEWEQDILRAIILRYQNNESQTEVVPDNTHYLWDLVVGISDLRKHVYDLSVPDGEMFVANGITCHNSFDTEHGANFSDRVRGWIEDSRDLTDCVVPELRPISRGNSREPFWAGLDFGIVNDGTSIALTSIRNGVPTLGYHEIWYAGKKWRDVNPHLESPLVPYALTLQDVKRLDISEIAEWLRILSSRFYIVKGVFDQWAGPIFEQELHKRSLTQFESRFFSPADSSHAFNTVKMMMYGKQMAIYDYPVQVTDLSANSKHYSPLITELLELQSTSAGKNINIVEAPKIPGKHDDMSDAFVRSMLLVAEHIKEHPDALSVGYMAGRPTTHRASQTYLGYQRTKMRLHGPPPRERTVPRHR